jgi:hypothetical protein
MIGQDDGFDLQALRERLRKMPDNELLLFGHAAKYMCLPKANHGKTVRRGIRDPATRG